MESKQADEILAALPWRCFQCDFVTSDPEKALAHFGDRDDGEEFKPICKWWANMDEHERLETLQDTIRELNHGADENMRLLTMIEGLECQVNSQESAIRSYKPFRSCHSIHDVFCLFDSMEGRALAAEEKLKKDAILKLDYAAIRAQAFAEIAALTEVNKEETMRVTPEQLEKAVFAASGKWCAGLNSWEHAIAAAMQPVDGDVVPLSDCPIGLFKSVSTGTLCLKTEYGLDSYIIESGERFWGGTSSQDTLADVKVIPVAMASRPDALAIRAQAFAERDAQWGRALIAGTQSVSLTFTEETVEEFKERLTRKESTLEEKIVKILDCFPWPQEKQWRTRAQVAAEIAALMEAKK